MSTRSFAVTFTLRARLIFAGWMNTMYRALEQRGKDYWLCWESRERLLPTG